MTHSFPTIVFDGAAYHETPFSQHRENLQGTAKNGEIVQVDFYLRVIVVVTGGRYINVYGYDEYPGSIEITTDDGTEYTIMPFDRKVLEKIGL